MTIVKLARPGCPESASALRELADKVESGEIQNLVIAYREPDDYAFGSIGLFKDRWVLLGALEYAKVQVLTN